MISVKKLFACVCAAALLLSAVCFTASADNANVTYTGNSGDLIFQPGSEHSPTDLFANFKNVMPGDSLTQKITVNNKANKNVTVKIFMRSLGSTDEAYNEFLNQLTLTVTKETDTPMFEAAADKTAGLTNWVCLGTLYSGGSLNLNVTLNVPTSLQNNFQNQIGKIKWQFVSEEFPVKEPAWKCPSNPKHTYHIEEIDGVSTFVCNKCKNKEPLKCEVCGGKMHEVIIVETGGKTYTAYSVTSKHYVSADGKVHFYLNNNKIIDYYTVNGIKTNIKNVSEYKLYTFYECVKNKQHHTDPHPPQTGDDSHIVLWVAVMASAGICLLILLLLLRKKKDNAEKEARAKC